MFDWSVHRKTKSNKKLIKNLCKKKYGVTIDLVNLTIKKVVGGLMVDETKAKTVIVQVDLEYLKNKSLDEQLTIIENLFNKDY